MADPDWPDTFALNAWTGEEPTESPVAPGAAGWALTPPKQGASQLLAAAPPLDLRNWRHPEVGWGLVLPENEAISGAERAEAADAPAAIRKLLEDRAGAPVFRYRQDVFPRFLRRYYTDRPPQDIDLDAAPRGIAPGRLPWYLLLVGSPEVLPWSVQYVLNTCGFIGRLALDDDALERYVGALLSNWSGAACRPDRPVVWGVDHGGTDITRLMRQSIADPVAERLASDTQINGNVRKITGPGASAAALISALSEANPALVVTTSHGMTGPLHDRDLMGRQLGLLVDEEHKLLDPETLLAAWQPDGAIWYSHACCSAGSDAETRYKGLVPEGSMVEQVLLGVAGLGARVAPFPTRLLGAEKPLRAFVGHVEPTFDWTLRAETRQILTTSIKEALYEHLYQAPPETLGMAFRDCYLHVGRLLAQRDEAERQFNKGKLGAEAVALRCRLTAYDRQSMVILGDPTAALPPLP